MLNERDRRVKKYLALRRREKEVSEEIDDIPLVKLDEAIQRGWEVYIALSDEAKRHKHYSLFEMVIQKYGMTYTTKKVDIVREVRKVRKYHLLKYLFTTSINGQTYYSGPQLRRLNLKNCQSFEDKYRSRYIIPYSYDKDGNYKDWQFYIPHQFLILKVRPNMLSHRKLINTDLESEKFLLNRKIWYSYDKDNPFIKSNGGVRSRWSKHQIIRRNRKLMNQSLSSVLNGGEDFDYTNKKLNKLHKGSW